MTHDMSTMREVMVQMQKDVNTMDSIVVNVGDMDDDMVVMGGSMYLGLLYV
jgi:hypothetical protein